MSEKILCIAEKLSLAEAAGNVMAEQKGIKPAFPWEDAKKHQYNQVGDVKFIWLDGHAFEQAEPDHYLPADVPTTDKGKKRWRVQDLPIIPQAWTIQPKEQKRRRLDMLADELKRCDLVYHMGDPDAEGQVLVDECLQFYNYKGPVKRVLINDYNTSKVKEALANIRDNNEPMFRAWYMWGLARSRYDWLLGMNATRAMTLRGQALGFDGLLPVGSVQTPLLYIVRERDRLIECFKPIPYYTLSAVLNHANGSFLAKWKARDNQPGLDSEGRLISDAEVQKLITRLSGSTGKITSYSKTKKQEKAPITLSMNELQIEGFRKFGYSGMQVLDAGQTLYEKYKVMSYPRSDNRYLSEVKHADAPAVMAAVFAVRPDLAGLGSVLDASRKSSAFNDKEMEKSPHHGIIPLVNEFPVDASKWTQIERDIYELVARSYLAQFAAPYEYEQTAIEADIDGEVFAASGRTPVAEGWKAIYAEAVEDADEEAEDSGKQALPVMAKDDPAKCEKCESKSRNTKAPARFDDAMLTECMMNLHKYVTDPAAKARLKEGDGIGTTATRGPMVDGMKERELFIPAVPAKKGSGKLMTSPAARALIDALPHEVKDPTQAGVFKNSLDQVAKSADPVAAYKAFEAQTVAWIRDIVEQSKTIEMTLPASSKAKAVTVDTTYPCTCGKGYMQARSGQHGPFWSCSARPECNITLPDNKGKPGVRSAPAAPAGEHKCPECGKPLRPLIAAKGANSGKKFWGCTGFAEGCKYSVDDDDGKPGAKPAPASAGAKYKCPKCGQLMRLVPAKPGKSTFWSCTAYPICKSTLNDKDGKPVFKTTEVSTNA